MNEPDPALYERLFRDGVPLIDVRAPVEFARGAFPAAVNLPILTDAEREQVGITYKEDGNSAATALGHDLVSGANRSARITAWQTFIEAHPDAHLYCFRGGQRSQIAVRWLAEAGFDVPRIPGGYKAMRQFLLTVIERPLPMVVVGGKTGVGKTEVLVQVDNHLDLEGIARHRGSAFGGRIEPQPGQIDFENLLAIAILNLNSDHRVIVEDEGRLIGRIHVPLPLQDSLKTAPLVVIEDELDARVERVYGEYIERQWPEYRAAHGEGAGAAFAQYLLGAVDAIRKRLGGARHSEVRRLVEGALAAGDLARHRDWIRILLTDYYDPMYEYQLSRKQERVVFTGRPNEVTGWLAEKKTKQQMMGKPASA